MRQPGHRARADAPAALSPRRGRHPHPALPAARRRFPDFVDVREALRADRIRDAAEESARGPLLPLSEAPGVRAEREQLGAIVRAAVVHRGDAESMWALARTPEGREDTELVARLLRALPPTDPRHIELAAQHPR